MKFLKNNWQILFILLLALLLRLPLLNGSLWLDEAAQAIESSRPFNQQLAIMGDFQPPLIHYIIHFALYISKAEWWLRTIGALIPGLITIYATYKIGEKLGSKKMGLIASLLLSTSSFHIYFSQELRPYSLPAMWATLSWLPIIAKQNQKKLKIKNLKLVIFSILSLLGLYSSYLYPFLFLTQLIYLNFFKKLPFKQLFFIATIVGLGYLPWLPSFFTQLSVGQHLRQELPGWETVVSIPQLKSIPLVFGKYIFGVLDLKLNIPYLLIGFIIISFSFKLFLQFKKKSQLSILLLWLFFPLITAWLVSFYIPVIRPKRMLYLMPSFFLLIANLVTQNQTKLKLFLKTKTNIGSILFIIVLAVNSYSVLQYYLKPEYQRENWRALYQEIQNNYPQEKTIIAFSYPHPFSPWDWYAKDNYPTFSTGAHYIKNAPDLTQNLKQITQYDYVLVFDYLRDLTDPDDQLIQEIEAFGYKGVGVIDYPNIGFVRVYAKPDSLLGYDI